MELSSILLFCEELFTTLCAEAEKVFEFLNEPLWSVFNATEIFDSGLGAFLLTILNAITDGNIVALLTHNSLIDLMFGASLTVLLGFIVVRSLVSLFK